MSHFRQQFYLVDALLQGHKNFAAAARGITPVRKLVIIANNDSFSLKLDAAEEDPMAMFGEKKKKKKKVKTEVRTTLDQDFDFFQPLRTFDDHATSNLFSRTCH